MARNVKVKANLFQKGYFRNSEYPLFCQLFGAFQNKYLFQYELCLKRFIFNKKNLEKKSRKMQKNGCSLCKSENPLYKNIPSEKICFYIAEKSFKTTLIFFFFFFSFFFKYWKDSHLSLTYFNCIAICAVNFPRKQKITSLRYGYLLFRNLGIQLAQQQA